MEKVLLRQNSILTVRHMLGIITRTQTTNKQYKSEANLGLWNRT